MNTVTIIVLIILVVITLVYLARKKLIVLTVASIHLVFPVLLLVSLSALFLPQVYHSLTDFGLQQTTLPSQFKNLDNIVGTPAQLPQTILGEIGNLLGQKSTTTTPVPGVIETQLYPQFVNLISEVIRFFSLIFSIIGLIVTIYLSYISSSMTDYVKLEQKYENLLIRLNKLEAKDSSSTNKEI